MGAPDVDKVRVGITGGVRVAPVGTTAPTDATTAYGAGWTELGYVSEDGIEETPSQDTTIIRAWQNGTIVRRVISSSEQQFAFTIIETNEETWALYYPGSTFATALGTTTATIKVPAADPRAFAFDVVDGDVHTRILVPRGEVGERGSIVYKGDEPIGYSFTMTAYPDENGVVFYKITDDANLDYSA